MNTVKQVLKWGLILVVAAAVFLSGFLAGFLELRNGYTYVSVFRNGELCSIEEYRVSSDMGSEGTGDGYRIETYYGEVRGTVCLSDGTEIEFGFFNTNGWHKCHIRLELMGQEDQCTVRQTVSYMSDNGRYDVLVNEAPLKGTKVSVFREGL